MAPLKILFICNKSPWPPKEGGSMAMNNLIEGLLGAGARVRVLAVESEKYQVASEKIPADYRQKTRIEFVHLDLAVKFIPAFLNLFSRQSYHVKRFISHAFERKLTEILQRETFDIIQIETLFMAPYLETVRKYSTARVVLRAHNIEHLIWKRMALSSRNPARKFYLKHLFSTLENYEKKILDGFDAILPITEKDATFFKTYCQKPVKTIPFGINLKDYSVSGDQHVERALYHIGAMNWMPNEEGIRWFLKRVWPQLRQKFPALKLYLAGRAMPRWLLNLKMENIIVAGEVPDARAFILSKSTGIVPLFSGSGVRIKIIESMALGKAVVSTRTGAEGIAYTDGENILIADTAMEFVSAISRLYKNPGEEIRVGQNARRFVETKYDNRKIIGELQAFYREIL